MQPVTPKGLIILYKPSYRVVFLQDGIYWLYRPLTIILTLLYEVVWFTPHVIPESDTKWLEMQWAGQMTKICVEQSTFADFMFSFLFI